MNKERRARIQDLIVEIEVLRDKLDQIIDDEQNYMDNMPENLLGSERYEKAEEAVSQMEEAGESLDEARDTLMEALE